MDFAVLMKARLYLKAEVVLLQVPDILTQKPIAVWIISGLFVQPELRQGSTRSHLNQGFHYLYHLPYFPLYSRAKFMCSSFASIPEFSSLVIVHICIIDDNISIKFRKSMSSLNSSFATHDRIWFVLNVWYSSF